MNEPKPQWYIVGSKNQTRGPFTTGYIIKRCLSGKFGRNALCWRDGMKDWQPLDQVQPFQVEIEKVKQEQMVVEIRLLIDEAKSLYADATTMTGTDAVENLKKARMKLGHAEFMLNSISAAYRPQGIEKRIKDLIALVEDLLKQKVIEQKEYELKVAQEFADKISSWDEEYLIKRINNLINRAYLAIHREQYKQAELLLEKVIKLDPANREAKYLLRMVQKKGDAAAEKDIENRYDLELRRTLLRTKEYMIPYVDIII